MRPSHSLPTPEPLASTRLSWTDVLKTLFGTPSRGCRSAALKPEVWVSRIIGTPKAKAPNASPAVAPSPPQPAFIPSQPIKIPKRQYRADGDKYLGMGRPDGQRNPFA
ncbi:hypothetical protein HDU67_002989, partial [Dinochytrium kinnereticum]